ncbi:MAG: hypothetical protein IPK11_14390 [Ignavibacteria bacterium]|nr:hypothetical protein [Ignavibacteria bacterium]
MKSVFFSTLFVLLTHCASAQLTMLGFLQGTWKIQNKEKYEHWDVLNKEMMKGISYSTVNGQLRISEYMELRSGKDSITYIAHVINQNNGNGIPFTLVQSDSIFSFENPAHDFPKKIEYIPKSATQILVRVSDGKKKGFSYILEKQVAKNIQKDTMNTNPNYDAKLAEKLNADDYGMKKYVLVILKTGNNQSEDKDFISQCFRGHLDNINRLVKEGKMIVAGPLTKNDKTYRGIFILNVSDFSEAKQVLEHDAAIKEGLLDMELFSWYGSAALPEYLPFSDKIWKAKP